jgi:hypothetical protein
MRAGSDDIASSAPFAVVLPGLRYGAQAPLLYWAAEILRAAGWHVEPVSWTADIGSRDATAVERAIEAAFSSRPSAKARLVVAKSIGTLAAPWCRRHDVPGIWLTPLLSDPSVVEALSNARGDIAIGGDADPHLTVASIGEQGAEAITIPGADHSLRLDSWRASLSAQQEIFARIDEHVRQLPAD